MKSKPKHPQSCYRKHLLTFLLAGTLLFTHSILCANVYSQKKIDISMKDATLIEILKRIDQQSEFSVLYRSDQLEKFNRISIDLKDASVEDILGQCLRNTGLSYQINDQTIVITKNNSFRNEAPQQKMIEIKGTVTDNKKQPLIGATIIIKGTSIGVVTDENGNFSLRVPEGTAAINVSYIGYQPREISLGNQTSFKVVLEEDMVTMDDVVVTGFFTRKKEGFAGTVNTIKKEELQKVSTGNIFTTINTLDAGFKINENNLAGSNPNVIPDFTIRGKGSFQNGSTSPLFILDGFEVNAEKIFDMDINRIESITLLKDASATILYGSRAANGVIVIETTAPKAGQLRVTYDFKPTVAIADLTGYDLMNAQEKLTYEKEAGLYDPQKNESLESIYKKNAEYYKRYKNILEGVDTYWLSQPVHNSFSHAHSLFIEGGVDNVRYGIDAAYNKQEGVMIGSGRDRVNLGFSLIYRIKDKITIKNYLSYAHTHQYESPFGDFSQYSKQNPYERTRDERGDMIPLLTNGEPNPLYDAMLPSNDYTNSQEFREQINVDWMIGHGFQFRGQVGINKSNSEKNKYTSPFAARYVLKDSKTNSFMPLEERGELGIENGKLFEVSSNITLNYNKLFAEKHLLYGGIGMELNTAKSDANGYVVTGFPDDRYSDPAFAIQYKKGGKATSTESHSRSIGFFANLNYIYDNRYFVDASFRTDGSSRFGSDRRFAPFWSLGAGWNIHNEKFWGENSIVDLLKLRYSYGVTGNQEFSAYQAKTTFQFNTSRPYNTLLTSTLMGYGNPDLEWQKQYTSNVGLDFGLAKSRLRIALNYYNKRTEGMLTEITVAPSIGLPNSSFTANLGKIKNTGWEVNLNGVIIRNQEKDLEWAVSFQGAHNKNVLVEISNQLKGINDKNNKEDKVPGAVYEEGQSMTAIKAVRSLGIDPLTGNEIFVKKDGSITYEWNAEDKVLCGDTEPDLFGNIGTNLYWKGWNLNMVFRYSFGADLYNQTLASRVEGADPAYNADRRVLNDRWREPGQHALYKNIAKFEDNFISSRFVQRENMIQLGSLSLSYDFKKEWLQKFRVNTLRLSFYANDLLRFSTIKEERGLSYPFQRSFVFGLNVNF